MISAASGFRPRFFSFASIFPCLLDGPIIPWTTTRGALSYFQPNAASAAIASGHEASHPLASVPPRTIKCPSCVLLFVVDDKVVVATRLAHVPVSVLLFLTTRSSGLWRLIRWTIFVHPFFVVMIFIFMPPLELRSLSCP